jgi:hypothetical protein
LIKKKATYSLDKGLNFALDRVLMLMTGSSGLHDHAMVLKESCPSRGVVL